MVKENYSTTVGTLKDCRSVHGGLRHFAEGSVIYGLCEIGDLNAYLLHVKWF